MTKQSEKVYPEVIKVGGVPFRIGRLPYTGEALRRVSEHDYFEQTISIQEHLPYPRGLSYLLNEVAILLLEAAGVSANTSRNKGERFGPVLYRIIRENKFDWIYADEVGEPPTTVFVNGMPYTVVTDADDHLDTRDEAGEVAYAELLIRIHSKLQGEVKAVTFLHELAHAALYEARLVPMCNQESLIEPLSHILYQFFKQNDFSFAYNG